MSIATGLAVWAFARAMGLDLALEWGVIAFVLNYIPFIGPLVATVFPTAVGLLQFGSWQAVVTPGTSPSVHGRRRTSASASGGSGSGIQGTSPRPRRRRPPPA